MPSWCELKVFMNFEFQSFFLIINLIQLKYTLKSLIYTTKKLNSQNKQILKQFQKEWKGSSFLFPFTHPPTIFFCHNKPNKGDKIKYDCLLFCLADSSPTVLSKINVMAVFV